MKIHNVQQGTEEWHDLRANHFTASEAPVMMASHPNMKRDELLAAKATKTPKEYSSFVEDVIFTRGHDTEENARPILESIIGEELFPVVGTQDKYLASFDGLTMSQEYGFEHKQWNESLAEAVRSGKLPEYIYWQLEHQFLVCDDLKGIHFVVSDGTRDKHEGFLYQSVPERREKLLRGWAQFEKDLADFKPVVEEAAPIAKSIPALPALNVRLSGEVMESNLPEYKEKSLAFIGTINTDLQTDQDFADAEEAVKWCKSSEDKIETVKEQALSQTRSIDELFRAMDEIKDALRTKRLELDKLVKDRKQALRNEIVQAAQDELNAAISDANQEFAPVTVGRIEADFWAAIKGKRNFASIRSAVNDELAKAKISLNESRDHVRASIKIINDAAGDDYKGLFHDIQQLVDKDHDHLNLLVKTRIDEHKAAEQKRIDAAAQNKEAEQEEIPEPTIHTSEQSTYAQERVSGADKSEFGQWWHEVGSAITPRPGEDSETHVYRVAQAAWTAARTPHAKASGF